mmetsp:Transcript_61840/g.100049  ORF Transcript_61840/g.100049 Transcript_61840/m.100049 type:complete len:109 (-) Transcript_61840:332-658(-)
MRSKCRVCREVKDQKRKRERKGKERQGNPCRSAGDEHRKIFYYKDGVGRDTNMRKGPTETPDTCAVNMSLTVNLYGFELHRPSIKDTKLLFQVMQAIIFMKRTPSRAT